MSHPQLSGFSQPECNPPLPASVKFYVVGGAVRDELLDLPSSDRDWVVVGATVDDMLASGFKPVGSDFPVFLHPQTNEEFALARTERKSGHGYKGFVFHASPEVTLEEDLLRRDFTINAMAMSQEGRLIDPYGGLSDLRQRVIRHVSEAYQEDPLRVLRLARFLAKFEQFQVDSQTEQLCRSMVLSGETSHLVPERSFAELDKGMSESRPSRMWRFLGRLGLTKHLADSGPLAWSEVPELQARQLDQIEGRDRRWAFWMGMASSTENIAEISSDLRIPNEIRDLSMVAFRLKEFLLSNPDHSVDQWVSLLSQVDVYRKPERVRLALDCLEESVFVDGGVQSSEPATKVLSNLIESVISGRFKLEQRQCLASWPDLHPAQAVHKHKSDWVQSTLNQFM